MKVTHENLNLSVEIDHVGRMAYIVTDGFGGGYFVWTKGTSVEQRNPTRREFARALRALADELEITILEDASAVENKTTPAHYGGADNPYEAIKVIRNWNLNFALGNAVKYIARAGKKSGESALDDLKKAAWYIQNEIEALEKK